MTMLGGNHDPRPDLAVDHELWEMLLSIARRDADPKMSGLWEVLDCLRGAGAGLKSDLDYGLVIWPGECPQTEYDSFRGRYLAPRKVEITRLLRRTAAAVLVARVEARLLSIGWTGPEIWAEQEWNEGAGGRRKSLYATLLNAIQTWSGTRVKIGHVSANDVEIIIGEHRQRLYRDPLAARQLFDQCEPPEGKKEAV